MPPVTRLDHPQEAARHLAVLVFHAVTCVHAIVTRGHFGMWSIWNGYPGTVMPLMSKSFFLCQFAFWCQCVLYDSTVKGPNSPSIPKTFLVYVHQQILSSLFLPTRYGDDLIALIGMMAGIMFIYDTDNLYKEIQDHGPRTAAPTRRSRSRGRASPTNVRGRRS